MIEEIIMNAKMEDNPVEEAGFENEEITGADGSKIDFKQVRFTKCRFAACDFTGAGFENVTFENCDFSNCIFGSSYWKGAEIRECKADGSDFNKALLKDSLLEGNSFQYANCVSTSWENCTINDCNFKEAFLSEVKFKKTGFHQVDFTRVDFFKTPLKGIDLSECTIDGILMSETRSELQGAKVNMMQAAVLAQLLGVKII